MQRAAARVFLCPGEVRMGELRGDDLPNSDLLPRMSVPRDMI